MTRGYQGKYRHLQAQKKAPKESSCDNKKALTMNQAQEVVRNARFGRDRQLLYWYQCEWCHKYHVTSK